MTKNQANEMLTILKDIREQITRVANSTNDGTFTLYTSVAFGPLESNLSKIDFGDE